MKKDNRGISLIELLVAVAMFVVIMTPMLNSFMLSGRNNYKSRNLLRATTIANNLMEGMEAFSLEEICEQFNTSGQFKIYQTMQPQEGENQMAMAYKELESDGQKSGVVSTDALGNNEYTFKGTENNKYYFVLTNIKEDGNYYDAKITLDASGYRTQEGQSIEDIHYNEQYSFQIDTMNSLTDAVLICTPEEERLKYSAIKDEYNTEKAPNQQIKTVESMMTDIKREIRISFEDYAGDDVAYQENGAYVNLDVTYYFKNVKYNFNLAKSLTIADVRNIYLLYYPNYFSTKTKPLDKIIIETDRNKPYTLFLVKQILIDNYFESYYMNNTNASVDENMMLREKDYWADIKIIDKTATKSEIDQDGFVSEMRFRTNLTSNIQDDNSIKQFKNFSIEYVDKNNAAACTYPAVNNDNSKMEEILQFVNGYPQSLAGEIQNDNIMYETIVEIYPQGSYEAGTMNEENRMVILNRK